MERWIWHLLVSLVDFKDPPEVGTEGNNGMRVEPISRIKEVQQRCWGVADGSADCLEPDDGELRVHVKPVSVEEHLVNGGLVEMLKLESSPERGRSSITLDERDVEHLGVFHVEFGPSLSIVEQGRSGEGVGEGDFGFDTGFEALEDLDFAKFDFDWED